MTLRKNKRGFSVLLYVIARIETPNDCYNSRVTVEKERRKKKERKIKTLLLDWTGACIILKTNF